MTPEIFFLRYAFPCVDFLMWSKKISEEQARSLTQMIKSYIETDRTLLTICFPNACFRMCTIAQQNNRDPWSMDNVQDYWRNNHFGSSPVDKMYVLGWHNEGIIALRSGFDGKEDGLGFFNMYDLQLFEGDVVYIHKNWVIEKA